LLQNTFSHALSEAICNHIPLSASRRETPNAGKVNDQRQKSADCGAFLPQRSASPPVDKARAHIHATRHIRHSRDRPGDGRENPNPVFVAPPSTPLAARNQCHPTHAVQLASLMKAGSRRRDMKKSGSKTPKRSESPKPSHF